MLVVINRRPDREGSGPKVGNLWANRSRTDDIQTTFKLWSNPKKTGGPSRTANNNNIEGQLGSREVLLWSTISWMGWCSLEKQLF